MTDEEKRARKKEYNAKYWAAHKDEIAAKRSTPEALAWKRERERKRRENLQGEALANHLEKQAARGRAYRRRKKLADEKGMTAE